MTADPAPPSKQRASELAAQSAEHYKRGEYEIAVALLRQAYALYPQPNLLYNLGRSLEKLGDVSGAIDAYEQYLATGIDIHDRDAITQRIQALRAQLPPPPPPVDSTPQPVIQPTLAPQPPPAAPAPIMVTTPMPHEVVASGASPLPWITVAAGVATLGVGGVFGDLASSKHNAAVSQPVATTALDLQNEAERYAKTANVLFVAGGAVTVAGAIWEIVDRTHTHRVVATIGPRGAMITARW